MSTDSVPKMLSITKIAEQLLQPLPYITSALPGVGGVVKSRIEDFVVEEIPAYLPCGDGGFLYLWIEKRDLAAEQLTSHLAKFLKLSHQDIGMAGMKDRQAITRQWVSVPAICQSRLATVQHPGITILDTRRHRNKLRTGHLKGNRFSILLRNSAEIPPGTVPTSQNLAQAEAIAQSLRTLGIPNFFGDQRFGKDSETLELGLELLNGKKYPGDLPKARRKFLLRLALSSAQSALFNVVLRERIQEELFRKVMLGDVMQVVASGGVFVVDDVEREQPRVDTGEIAITGPMFGPRMKDPTGVPLEREARALAAVQLGRDAFGKYPDLTSGTRRPFWVDLHDLQLTAEPEGLRLVFTLPSGSYATVVLREFQQTEAGEE